MESAKLASERAARVVHLRMGRGRASLASIASTAFFVGSIGTILRIFASFSALNGERYSVLAAIRESLSEALWPTAAGLLIALFASWGKEYVCD